MTFAFWMILVAALLPYATVGFAKRPTDGRAYDNANPRAWERMLEGKAARALAAHNNHFEAFAPFAAAVVVAQFAHAPQGWINTLAALFILLRIAYTVAYIGDHASLRSSIWFGGLLCVVALFCIGI